MRPNIPTRIGEMQIGMMYDEVMEKERGPYQPGQEPAIEDGADEQPTLPDNVISMRKYVLLRAAREATGLEESVKRHPAKGPYTPPDAG